MGSVLAALCGVLGSSQAVAAADDINAAPSPASAFGSSVLAAGQRLADRVIESEQAVVGTLKQNATAAPAWNVSSDVPVAGRAIGYVLRANSAAAAATAANTADNAPRTAAAAADLSFGARLRVLRGDADLHIPVVAWMADVQPASGAAFASSTVLRPSTHVSAEWSLPGDFSLGVMPGMAIDLDATGRRYANGTLAITVGKAWTPQWHTFVDMARDRLAAVQLGGTSTTLDAGVSFLATSTTQLDLALTHGLSAAAPPFQAGVGVSSSF